MYAKRLLKLAAHMEGIDARTYYQNNWMKALDGEKITPDDVDVGEEVLTQNEGIKVRKITVREGACNTAMCVFGHAVGAVPEADLFFMTYDEHIKGGIIDSVMVARADRNGNIEDGFKAAAKAFQIPEKHAEALFGFHSEMSGTLTYDFYGPNLTNTVVAAKLREYVETNGAVVEAMIN